MYLTQVANAPAYPPTRGEQQRIHGLVSARGPNDEVARVVHATVPLDDRSTVRIDERYTEYRTRHLLQYAACFLTSRLFSSPPVFTSAVLGSVSTPVLDRELSRADVVFVERPWHVSYVASQIDDATGLVYSSHNYEPEMYAHLAGPVRDRLRNRVRTIEHRAVAEADLTIVTSERDREQYEVAGLAGPFHVAPNATSLDPRPTTDLPVPSRLDRRTTPVLFVGSPHYPNVVAVENLCAVVRDQLPDETALQVYVVGAVADAFEQVPDGVTLVGFVDDLDPWYEHADVLVNPVTTGAGTNTKMAEYFATGTPVVSTPFGARGIPATAGKEYVEAPLDEFGPAIRSVTEEQENYGAAARDLVERRLNWTAVSADLFEVLEANSR